MTWWDLLDAALVLMTGCPIWTDTKRGCRFMARLGIDGG